jgi:hypothetical protein
MIKPDDLPNLLDSMEELFKLLGDNVTPTNIAERMTTKTGRPYQFHQISYLLRSFGFMTRHLDGKPVGNYCYVFYDKDLINLLKKECPRIREMAKLKVENLSPYSQELKRTDVNLFEPNLRSYRIK